MAAMTGSGDGGRTQVWRLELGFEGGGGVDMGMRGGGAPKLI
jgi:hypothetical protein